MDPSWHHNYASLAWFGGAGRRAATRTIPSIKPELVQLTSALHGLAHNADDRAQYMADAAAYADKFKLSGRAARGAGQARRPAIVKMGAHPLVPFLANMQIQRLRRG